MCVSRQQTRKIILNTHRSSVCKYLLTRSLFEIIWRDSNIYIANNLPENIQNNVKSLVNRFIYKFPPFLQSVPKMHGCKKSHLFYWTEKMVRTFPVLGRLGLIGKELLQTHPNSHPILVVTFNLITRFSFYFHGSNVFQLSPSYYVTFSLAKSHCGLILPEFECLQLQKLVIYTLMLGLQICIQSNPALSGFGNF